MSVSRASAIRSLAFAAGCVWGVSLFAEARPCEEAGDAIVEAGGYIERGVVPPAAGGPPGAEPPKRADDGSDPCRNVVTVKFRRPFGREEAVLAALPGIALLDRPDAITLDLDRLDPAWFDELAGHAEAVGKLKAIRLRSESYEPLVDDDLAPLAKLPNLELLALSTKYGNGVTDAGLVHLKDLRRLKSLFLHGAQITDGGLSHLSGLDSLEFFVADRTELTGAGLPHLDGAPLKILHLIETKLDDAGLANVGRFEQLETLSISHCPIDGTGLVHLARLRNLDRLDLSATNVDDARLATLPELPKLATLRLTGTRISDASIDLLIARPTLRDVSLSGTSVTDEGIRRLRVANPRLRIRF